MEGIKVKQIDKIKIKQGLKAMLKGSDLIHRTRDGKPQKEHVQFVQDRKMITVVVEGTGDELELKIKKSETRKPIRRLWAKEK